MSAINDGGPAFPTPALDGSTDDRAQARDGMTLRDYFAAKAMQGMLANNWNHNYESWAVHAYMMADEMLKARGGQQ